jgi:ribosomal protein S6--L-glutamate ligase
MSSLAGLMVAVLERPHPPGYRGGLVTELVPALAAHGARVELVHAEMAAQRLDTPPPWDAVVLKSGSAAALHLAAAAAAWGIPSVNDAEATRLAQDRLASMSLLAAAGLPVPRSRLAWLDCAAATRIRRISARPLVVKALRGSRGEGVFPLAAGELPRLLPALRPAPYLLMERVPHSGLDLKVYAAGGWLRSILRPYPALTLDEKRGRPAPVPQEAAEVVQEVGRLLGLDCFGCDFVDGPDGLRLVDVNAFPGYKGADGAAAAIAALVEQRVDGCAEAA